MMVSMWLLFMMSTCDELFDQGLEGIKKAIRTVDCIITDYDNPEEFNKFIQGI